MAGFVLICLPADLARASLLLPPAVGAADSALNGASVSAPLTPEGAMFQNPAGLVAFERAVASMAIGVAFGRDQLEATVPATFDQEHNLAMVVPSGAVSVPFAGRWRFGWGLHGSVGASFDFEPVPPVLESGFYSETSIVAMPFALAYEVSDRLWIGVEIAPLFGYLRNRYPIFDPDSGAALPIKYTLRGPGVQGALGLSWHPCAKWSVGLGLRTPGAIWMDGSTPVAGSRRDVDLLLQMPTQLAAGLTRHFGERLDLSGSVRWTDSSRFGESDIEFAGFALPFAPDAHDEWKTTLGAVLAVSDRLDLLGSVSYASRVVGSRGVSPLLFDTEDVKVAAGVSFELGRWTLQAMGGYNFADEREISTEQALILPGRYEAGGGIVMLGLMQEM